MSRTMTELEQQADLFLQVGDADAALNIYQQITAQNDQDAYAWLIQGSIKAETGRIEEGVSDIRKAIDIDPGYAEAHYNLGNIYQNLNRFDDAVRHLELAVRSDSEFIEPYIMLAGILGQQGKLDESIFYSKKALELEPSSVQIMSNLAYAYQQAGNLQDSLYYFEKILSTDNPPPTVLLMYARAKLADGDYATAERYYKGYLSATDDNNIELLLELADIQLRNNDISAAIDTLQRVINLDPMHIAARTLLAGLYYQQENFSMAEELYKRLINIDTPSLQIDVLYNLALIYQKQTRYEESIELLQKIIQIQPGHIKALDNLAYNLVLQNKRQEAVKYYKQALEYEPASEHLLMNFANTLKNLGEYDSALSAYMQVLLDNPQNYKAKLEIANIYQIQGQYEKCIETLQPLTSIPEVTADACKGISASYVAMGRQEEALLACNTGLEIEPDNVGLLISSAAAMMSLGKEQQSLKNALRAAEINPDDEDASALLSTIYYHLGEKDKAYYAIEKHIESGEVTSINVALAFSGVSKSIGKQEQAVALMEKLLHNNVISLKCRINLHFALGKQYDSMKDYSNAFKHYQQGNRLKPAEFIRDQHEAGIEAHIKYFNSEFMKKRLQSANDTSKPVFIVGMARSGTSLVEQILSSHSRIHGAGELPNIIKVTQSIQTILNSSKSYPFCLDDVTSDHLDVISEHYQNSIESLSPDAEIVTDKMPGNFMNLGLIEMLFPNARIIHCTRNPIDTCLSGYFQDYSRSHPYSYDMDTLVIFYRNYLRMMQHWKNVLNIPIYEVQYENLVMNQREISAEMLAFCGLDWEDQCFTFHETGRFIGTASHEQVKQPMYSRSVERWRNYEEYIPELVKAFTLGEA